LSTSSIRRLPAPERAGSIGGMTRKLSISVPDDVAAWLDRQGNVSGAIVEAIRAQRAGSLLEQALRARGVMLSPDGKAHWRDVLNRPASPARRERAAQALSDLGADDSAQ
jgi:hypothetical protein